VFSKAIPFLKFDKEILKNGSHCQCYVFVMDGQTKQSLCFASFLDKKNDTITTMTHRLFVVFFGRLSNHMGQLRGQVDLAHFSPGLFHMVHNF